MIDEATNSDARGLLDELAGLYDQLDPVPPNLADDVRIAMTVASLEAEVAELVATPALSVRADDEPSTTDTITFSSGAVSLMVSVDDASPGGLTLDGWVTGGGATVDVHVGDDVRTAQADEYGRFVVTDVPRGRTWFVIRRSGTADEPPVVTPAVEL